jgi:hypothetical protein
MAIDAHEAHPGPKDETMTMVKDYATEDSRGRRVYVGQKWGPACHYPEGSNTCLTITYKGADTYSVQVGIDVYMTRQQAQDYIDRLHGHPFVAYLVDDDGEGNLNRTLFEIYLDRSSVSAWDGGLSAAFERQVGSQALDVDDGRDELYAKVFLFSSPAHTRFTSSVIPAHF